MVRVCTAHVHEHAKGQTYLVTWSLRHMVLGLMDGRTSADASSTAVAALTSVKKVSNHKSRSILFSWCMQHKTMEYHLILHIANQAVTIKFKCCDIICYFQNNSKLSLVSLERRFIHVFSLLPKQLCKKQMQWKCECHKQIISVE